MIKAVTADVDNINDVDNVGNVDDINNIDIDKLGSCYNFILTVV
ncbi:8852_t:CDS:2 [Funneliformis mosseae]|uniref:8852_t:CDS:1 n=1 Tax=Funneliformis mosseae TaxID=27381 RepID=A0A9N9C701_FUNMO|nr:8852_t:CDS:2 [Funneliformis mosseae]